MTLLDREGEVVPGIGVLAAPAPAGTSMSIATSARIVADVIDRLASEGYTFTRAYVQQAVCKTV